VPVIVTTAVVSTAIFASLAASASVGWKIETGLLSVAAAVLAALQTFFDYPGLAQRHQMAEREFSGLRRDIEILVLRCEVGIAPAAALDELTKISEQMDQLEQTEPSIPDRVYDKVRRRFLGPS
jgi:hypothetical protein